MLARLALSSWAKFLAIACLVAYANTGAPATTRCTAASTSSGCTMVAASSSNAYAVGTSWLLNLTTCSTQNMFAGLPQQMWRVVACELTAAGKQQKDKYLVLLPFKVAGKLLEVNELSLHKKLLHTGVAIQTAGSSKILAWLTHETKVNWACAPNYSAPIPHDAPSCRLDDDSQQRDLPRCITNMDFVHASVATIEPEWCTSSQG
jgi:hypothetical protein